MDDDQKGRTSAAAAEADEGDCLGCRVTGLMTGLGCGGFLSSRLFVAPHPKGAHRVALIAASAGFVAMGMARAVL